MIIPTKETPSRTMDKFSWKFLTVVIVSCVLGGLISSFIGTMAHVWAIKAYDTTWLPHHVLEASLGGFLSTISFIIGGMSFVAGNITVVISGFKLIDQKTHFLPS